MIVGLFLIVTLLLAFLALRLLWRSVWAGRKRGWPRFVLAVSLAVFVHLYGAWVYLSIYARYAFLLAFVITPVLALLRRRKSGKTWPTHAVAYIPLSALLILTDVLYFTGTAGHTKYALLAFPLSRGKYFVLQGGKGLPANVFHYNARQAVYAMDLVRLDRWGRRCTKIFSQDLGDYFIFGDTVYSPCDGTIERAIDDNPDNIPPHRARGPHNLNGVVLEGGDYTVFLGHLQQWKVFVTAGQVVKTGQPLGLTGNSGMSLEPHLHIQVHEKSANGSPWYRQPQLFIKFDNKEYLLFEEIDAEAVSLQ